MNISQLDRLSPIHPGEILLEEFLKPMHIEPSQIAQDIGVPNDCIDGIINEKRSVTADMALKLSRYFGLSERFWMNLQSRYDLETEKDRLQDHLEQEAKIYPPTNLSSWDGANNG
jgi:antitoxin HigA-1